MFWLDKAVWAWIVNKCATLGGAFYLGPVEGAIIYVLTIAWGISTMYSNKKGVKRR